MFKIIKYCTISGSMVQKLSYAQDELHPDCVALKLALTEEISGLCNSGVTNFFTNAEYGVPLWAAEVIVAMRGFRVTPPKIHIIVPYENQAVRWNEQIRERYYNIHESADTVTMLNSQYSDDCYDAADEFMIDNSVLLLTDGGNKYISDYAKKKNKQVAMVKSLITQ